MLARYMQLDMCVLSLIAEGETVSQQCIATNSTGSYVGVLRCAIVENLCACLCMHGAYIGIISIEDGDACLR